MRFRFRLRRPRPLQALQARIDAWVLARVKQQPGPVTIPRQRVYILPTRFGYGFALLALVMLLGSMNYTNSMGFALTFLIGALGLVGMHHTHANLAGVEVNAGGAAPVFAGEPARFELQLRQHGRRPHYSIAAAWSRATPGRPLGTPVDVPLEGAVTLYLALPTERRGWHAAPIFSVASEFPLGLFHAWTLLGLQQRVLVYPTPATDDLPPPQHAPAQTGEAEAARSGQDRFAGLRGYQRGDTLNTIHWKSLPKLQQPVVKQFDDPQAPECWLTLDAAPDVDLEARLSRLTRWVLDLDARGTPYGLELPDRTVPLGTGEQHRHTCLRALALHGSPEAMAT